MSPSPCWQTTEPRDLKQLNCLKRLILNLGTKFRAMLRVFFKFPDFFKNARFAKVKSPTEVVISTLRLRGDLRFQCLKSRSCLGDTVMGQDLLNPPTVEGWHTGRNG
ncbi:MAG: hypothetical protein CM1200mP15_15750 [Dehalococcoidia bacterium]|nr:MAG: hypothetical protein CM1200mP15_15750 [Dehalococcoidia bacterium]